MAEAKIISLYSLLCDSEYNPSIPSYQRPYKWDTKNVATLISDLSNAQEDIKKYGDQFKYRVGTVILHKVKDKKYEIVDGQQRLITFSLILNRLGESCSLFTGQAFSNKLSQKNIKDNYSLICDCITKGDTALLAALKSNIEVVLITVDRIAEAFQLFDSQNTRGRALDPHDLLKAYHLREMQGKPHEMRRAAVKWESVSTRTVRALFGTYLFPIKYWARREKSIPFTAKEIDSFKGISASADYTYAKRAEKAVPHYQLTDPFIAGGCFFEMTEHYIALLDDIKSEINSRAEFSNIKDILTKKEYRSTGFGYATELFYCVLLCYYDRFGRLDRRAVKKLFMWAFMLRVDMEHLGRDSISKYAIGDSNSSYTNKIPMFYLITNARKHTEICDLQISVKNPNVSGRYENLRTDLQKLHSNGGNQP